jgi:membrane protease YdiL (CAAX protease family)
LRLSGPTNHSGLSRSGLILALYGALALLAILISAGRGDLDIYRLDESLPPSRLLLGPVIGVAVGLGVVFLSRLAVHRFDWARRLHLDFRGILGHLSQREIIVLALASSVGEELLFRGALQPWLGLWPQAVIFALLHIGPGLRFLPWTVSAFVVGIVFGYMFEWTGDLGGPIAAHFTINYLNLQFISRVDLPAPPETQTRDFLARSERRP